MFRPLSYNILPNRENCKRDFFSRKGDVRMNTPDIHSFQRVTPMIYAYTHPDYPPHQGWSKIGYTEKQSVRDRIEQQNHTSDIA